MIYLDNAATSWPKPDAVVSAVVDALATGGNPGRGTHPAALASGRTLFTVRRLAARLFHTEPGQVVCSTSATAGLNVALQGLLSPGDHAVTTDLEHNSVLRPLYALREREVEVTIVPSERGVVAPESVAAALRPSTRVVALTHASNVLGTVQPVAEIAQMCAGHGVHLVVDAAQTAGLLPLDLRAVGAAAVACGGHKGLLGPQGTGLLVLAPGVLPRPLVFGGTGIDSFSETMPASAPEAYEAGTPNVPGLAGLAASLGLVLDAGAADRPSETWRTAMERARRLREGLTDLGCFAFPSTEPDAWAVPVVAGNVLDRTGGVLDSEEVADALAQRWGIAVRGGFHCAPLVHRRCGTSSSGMVRFSPGHTTTDAEIDAALDAVRTLHEES